MLSVMSHHNHWLVKASTKSNHSIKSNILLIKPPQIKTTKKYCIC